MVDELTGWSTSVVDEITGCAEDVVGEITAGSEDVVVEIAGVEVVDETSGSAVDTVDVTTGRSEVVVDESAGVTAADDEDEVAGGSTDEGSHTSSRSLISHTADWLVSPSVAGLVHVAQASPRSPSRWVTLVSQLESGSVIFCVPAVRSLTSFQAWLKSLPQVAAVAGAIDCSSNVKLAPAAGGLMLKLMAV